MKLSNLNKEIIKQLVEDLDNAAEYNDKDFWKLILSRVDNLERTTKIKMMRDLVEYWEKE